MLRSREIALRGLTGDPMLRDSFLVESDGSPGDVGTKLVSKSKDSRLHEVELLAKDFGGAANGGDHPWTIENGATSTLLLFNESSKPLWFIVQIAAGTVLWRKEYQLQPNQTIAININDLSRTAAKDDYGKAFPSDIWWGQIGWSVPQKNAGRGRLLQSNPEAAMARSFSCDLILVICDADLNVENWTVPVGQTVPYGEVTNILTCMNSCSGNLAGGGEQYAYSYEWSSENSNVASFYESYDAWDLNVTGIGSGSTSVDGWVSDGYCTVGVGGPIAVTPTILFNGTDVTGTTQSVVIGQQIPLQASFSLPAGVTISSQSWSVSGTTVGGYSASTSSGQTLPTTFTQQSTTFYWVTAQTGATVTYTVNLSDGDQESATATFNVSGPTSVNVTAPTTNVQIASGPQLEFGNYPATYGIVFNGSANQPSQTGTFEWVQLISAYNVTYSPTCHFSVGTGLDNTYPYSTGLSTADAPGIPLFPNDTSSSATFSAAMYLLWEPDLPDAIYVPLGYVQWGWSGSAVQNSGSWSLQSGSGSADTFTETMSYPEWTTTLLNGAPPVPLKGGAL